MSRRNGPQEGSLIEELAKASVQAKELLTEVRSSLKDLRQGRREIREAIDEANRLVAEIPERVRADIERTVQKAVDSCSGDVVTAVERLAREAQVELNDSLLMRIDKLLPMVEALAEAVDNGSDTSHLKLP